MNEAIFHSVRSELLEEAKRSPGLLADLANLERYIAETYSARSFIELLQNADDAKATRFLIIQEGDWLLCANNGQQFSRSDFYSLCRSAFSEKKRGQSIGYRGIGFKSVVGMVNEVHLISGELGATFSRHLTHESLGSDIPAPLLRIPHLLALPSDARLNERLAAIKTDGFSAIFVFCGINRARVEEEFALFDADYLLFLRNINEAALEGVESRRYSCSRIMQQKNCCHLRIESEGHNADWRIQSFDRCDIAFSMADGRPVPLTSPAALVHAFLPTLEQTGLGIRLNADFSTDPSRTRVVFDDSTEQCISSAASAIAKVFSDAIRTNSLDRDIAACLTPTFDLSTLAFQKRTLRTELIECVRKKLVTLKGEFFVPPIWLNPEDADRAARIVGKAMVKGEGIRDDGLVGFLRYLGVPPLGIDTVLIATHSVAFSEQGCAEVAAFSVRNAVINGIVKSASAAPIWEGSGSMQSLTALSENGFALSQRFLQRLTDAGLTTEALAKFIRLAVADGVGVLLPSAITGAGITTGDAPTVPTQNAFRGTSEVQEFDPLLAGTTKPTSTPFQQKPELESRFLPAWRGAEQYVAQILQHHRYVVEDRSRQNLGYDLFATKEGRKYYVEVKLLNYATQPFIITPNEEAVARECGEHYALALTLRGKDGVHIEFIHNPLDRLKFVRQCRQWVWECSDYSFAPHFMSYPENEK